MVLRAHITHQKPELLDPVNGLKLSMSWVRKFVSDELGWAERVGTRAAKKVPANAKELCTRTHNRLTFAMMMHNVPAELVVNADQGGVTLMPTGKRTYEKKGAKNVPLISHEEKRQFTVVLASCMDGEILPFQSIWGGSGPASLPSRKAERFQEADIEGFTYGHGDTRHWSSRQTTKDWIEETYVPYIARKKKKLGLPDDAKSILLLDVWPVHIANSNDDDFVPWMRKNHPNIIILYIPGGCK
ncbi:hypothetical protein PENSPDRAFT_574945 [Peniophora sp. CONT]|nr:hypothetical protein PENSPDRAFT_574945 [Peniophora sp. CONT]